MKYLSNIFRAFTPLLIVFAIIILGSGYVGNSNPDAKREAEANACISKINGIKGNPQIFPLDQAELEEPCKTVLNSKKSGYISLNNGLGFAVWIKPDKHVPAGNWTQFKDVYFQINGNIASSHDEIYTLIQIRLK